MLVDSITFRSSSPGGGDVVTVRVVDGGRAEIRTNREVIVLDRDELRALQSALTRVMEGR